MHKYLAVRKLLKISPAEGVYHRVEGSCGVDIFTQPLHATLLKVDPFERIRDPELKNWRVRIIEDDGQQRIIGVMYGKEILRQEYIGKDEIRAVELINSLKEINLLKDNLTIPLPSIGITSGGRSAIIQNVHVTPFMGFGLTTSGPFYKIKGCRLASQQYLLSAADIVEPEGAQSAEQAELECERTLHINDLLRAEGIIPPLEPVGWFEYAQRVGEQKAGALVARIRGDLRLDEIVRIVAEQGNCFEYLRKHGHRIGIALEEFLYELGRNAGKAKRVYDDLGFAWGKNCKTTNNHIGNFVIYEAERGRVRVGMVDLDGTQPRKSRLKRMQEREKEELEKQLCGAFHASGPREDENHNTIIKNNYAGPIASRGFQDGYRTRRAGVLPTNYVSSMLSFLYSERELLQSLAQLYILSSDHVNVQVLNKKRKQKVAHDHLKGWNLLDKNGEK